MVAVVLTLGDWGLHDFQIVKLRALFLLRLFLISTLQEHVETFVLFLDVVQIEGCIQGFVIENSVSLSCCLGHESIVDGMLIDKVHFGHRFRNIPLVNSGRLLR